jgi:hypothetical protein
MSDTNQDKPQHDPPREFSRRRLFDLAGRGLGIGALAAVSALLAARKQLAPRGDLPEACGDPKKYCPACGRKDDCGLPQAMSYRRGREEQS